MINQLSGSGNVDSCFPKPQKPPIYPSHKKIQKSFHCQPTLDALNDLVTEVRKPEPPLKRQKIEDNPNAETDGSSSSLRKPLGEYNAKLPVQQRSEIATTNGVRLPIKPVEEAPSSNAKTIQRTLPIFPDRPCLERRGIRKECASPTLEAMAKKNVQIKPYVPESPSSAPKYQNSGLADYNPWKGSHPEDVLNEIITRQGFYDKIQVSQIETSTAGPSVHSSLKHKPGLQILSSLFVSALNQKQSNGTVTASCTFKPPPRVTLTDNKREAWLRDLADPSIPLRRLSRTIPHGIRGKVLLDHCLAKDIPITRAVWLAKCVGANEIRAFKRKGASGAFAIGGENKWIRDWTMNVEAFVSSIICEGGAHDWKNRVNYSLRLVSHIFFEHLMDREHYIDWIISSLQSCDLNAVLTWLLLAQIYWKEILYHRQRGRCLVQTLLEHLFNASNPLNAEAFATVSHQLVQYLQSFMESAPACFLLPQSWNKYYTSFRVALVKCDARAVPQLEQLSQRNRRIQITPLSLHQHLIQSSEYKLITLLDKKSINAGLEETADACLSTLTNHGPLVTVALGWATCATRYGPARTYIVARLLRKWANRGVELERLIWAFLSSNYNWPQSQRSRVYRLLAELVHSKHLSIGRYLQWLMARGIMTAHKNSEGRYPSELQWLLELPIHGLPAHLLNLRRTLVSSLGKPPADEDDIIASTKAAIVTGLFGPFQPLQMRRDCCIQIDNSLCLSQTVLSSVSRWIRNIVASSFLSSDPDIQCTSPCNYGKEYSTPTVISLAQFQSIRSVLEKFEDFPILADVIKIFSGSNDIAILAAATDTINLHFDVFDAIGAITDLFGTLYLQHEKICCQKSLERPFIESLVDLGQHISRSGREVSKLRAELLIYVRNSSTAACSLVSETMVETLQIAEPIFLDEIEQVLSSGTIMENHTMDRIFDLLTRRQRISWTTNGIEQSPIILAELLTRLRTFDSIYFERLVENWLDKLLLSTDRPTLSEILPPFICSSALTLASILERTNRLSENAESSRHFFLLALEAFELTTLNLDLSPYLSIKQYRFFSQQRDMFVKRSLLISLITRATVEACSDTDLVLSARARTLVKGERLKSIIRGLLHQQSTDPDAVVRSLRAGLQVREVQNVIDELLYQSDMNSKRTYFELSKKPTILESSLYNKIKNTLLIVDYLNAPLCKLKIEAILAPLTSFDHRAADTVITAFIDQATYRNTDIMEIWASLLSGLPPYQAIQIRETAENQLLSSFPTPVETNLVKCEKTMYCMISIINATANTIAGSPATSVLTQITEKINSLLSLSQNSKGYLDEDYSFLQTNRVWSKTSYNLTKILLQLLTYHLAGSPFSRYVENCLVPLTSALSLLLIHPAVASHPDLAEHIFDVLSLFSDSLSDDARSQCFRALHDQNRVKDSRLLFLFGNMESLESDWLQLLTSASPALATKTEEPSGPVIATQPFLFRRWEMMQDATPIVTENDTSLNLMLFGTRKSIL